MTKYRCNHYILSVGVIFSLLTISSQVHAISADEAKVDVFRAIVGKNVPCDISDTKKMELITSIESSCLTKNSNGSYTPKSTCKTSGTPYDNLVSPMAMFCDQKKQAKAAAAAAAGSAAKNNMNLAAEILNNKGVNTIMKKYEGSSSTTNDASAQVQPVPNVGTSSVLGTNNSAVNKAINDTNKQIASANQSPKVGDKVSKEELARMQNEEKCRTLSADCKATTETSSPAAETKSQQASDSADSNNQTSNRVDNGDGTYTTLKANPDGTNTATVTKTETGEVVSVSKTGTNEQASKNYESTQPVAEQAAASTPAANAGPVGALMSNAKDAKNTAQAASQAKPEDKALATSFIGKIDAALLAGQSKCGAEVISTIGSSSACIAGFETALSALKTALMKYAPTRAVCAASNTSAGFLCPITTNPLAKDVQTVMLGVTPLLKQASSARESCSVLENTSNIAQYGLAAAGLVCTGSKLACDTSCQITSTTLDAMTQIASTLGSVPSAGSTQSTAAEMNALISAEKGLVTKNITECKAHAISLMETLKQGLAMAAASKSARDCKEKLSTGSGSSISGMGAGAIITTAEFCAKAENANNITCKCSQNPNADGCLGAFGSGKGAITQNKNSGSGMVSGNVGGGSSSSMASNKSPLSSEEKKALGLKVEDKNSSDSMMAGSGFSGSTDGSGSGGGGLSDEHNSANADAKKSKFSGFSFGSLAGGLGNLFGGGAGKSKSGAATGLSQQKMLEQEQAIKRKLASEQVRSEVSMASGKSNFDKVKNRYQITTGSLFNGQ